MQVWYINILLLFFAYFSGGENGLSQKEMEGWWKTLSRLPGPQRMMREYIIPGILSTTIMIIKGGSLETRRHSWQACVLPNNCSTTAEDARKMIMVDEIIVIVCASGVKKTVWFATLCLMWLCSFATVTLSAEWVNFLEMATNCTLPTTSHWGYGYLDSFGCVSDFVYMLTNWSFCVSLFLCLLWDRRLIYQSGVSIFFYALSFPCSFCFHFCYWFLIPVSNSDLCHGACSSGLYYVSLFWWKF